MATNKGDVALGSGSVTSAPSTGAYTLNGGTVAATSAAAVVSVGAVGQERQITNVAAGVVSATSTDAVNGSQFFTVASAVNTLGSGVATALGGGATVAADGTVTAPAYIVGGTTYNDVGGAIAALDTAGAGNIDVNNTASLASPVASGTNSTAVSPGATASGADSFAAGKTATASGDQSVALGSGATASGVSATALGDGATATGDDSTALGQNTLASGLRSTASGYGATASGDSSVAIGDSATSTGTNSVALGAGSTDGGQANVVSVGAAGAERKITNVAAGAVTATSTEAVNGGQLFSTNQQVAALTTTANGALQRSGGTMTGSIDMGGKSITNLAAPVNSGDAANKAYVDSMVVGMTSDVNNAFKAIDRANGGIAMAMAMGGLTMPDNKTIAVNASMGFFQDRQAFAVQGAARVDPNWVVNGAIGFTEDGGQIGGRVGITAAW